MKRLTKFKNVLLVVLVLCFVACGPDEETTRNTNTTVVVDPVTTKIFV